MFFVVIVLGLGFFGVLVWFLGLGFFCLVGGLFFLKEELF